MLQVALFVAFLACLPSVISVDNICPPYAESSCQPEEAQAAVDKGAYYWSQQKGGPARTGYSPFQVPTNLSKGPTWKWQSPHDDVIRATPLIDDKFNIYLSTIAGRIYKFSPSGEVIWTRTLDDSMPGVGALYKGKMWMGNRKGQVFALDMESGKETFRVNVSRAASVDAPGIFAYNDTIIVGVMSPSTFDHRGATAGNTQVAAVDVHDGTVKWRFAAAAPVFNLQPASPGDGTVIFQDQSGGLYRLRLGDGHLIWRSGMKPFTFRTTGASVVDDGLVFVMSNYQDYKMDDLQGKLHTYRLSDGQLLYQQDFLYHAGQAVAVGKLSPGAAPSVIASIGMNPDWPVMLRYLVHHSHPEWLARIWHRLSLWFPKWSYFSRPMPAYMIAFDAKTGNIQWRYDLEDWLHPACASDNELTESRYDDIKSGKNPNNDATCLPDSSSQPVISGDGTAIVGWEHGKVFAVRDANTDGVIDPVTEVSSYDFGSGFQGSAAMAPGMIAFATCGGGLYVFKS